VLVVILVWSAVLYRLVEQPFRMRRSSAQASPVVPPNPALRMEVSRYAITEQYGGTPEGELPYYNWHIRFDGASGQEECGTYAYTWSATNVASRNPTVHGDNDPIKVLVPGYGGVCS